MHFARHLLTAFLLSLLVIGTAARAAQDSDSDGFPDALESAFGTDPNNAASTPTGGAATAQKFPENFVATEFVDFKATADDDVLALQGYYPVPAGFDFSNKQLGVQIGGFARVFTLDASGSYIGLGEGVQFVDTQTAPSGTKFVTLSWEEPTLRQVLADSGRTGDPTSAKDVSLQVILVFNNTLHSEIFNGRYSVTQDATTHAGVATYTNATSSGHDAEIDITDFTSTPNPAKAGEPVTFTVKLKGKHVDVKALTASVDFGDGSAPASGGTNEFSHTFATDGVYGVVVSYSAHGASASAKLFVVVGTGAAVNALNGLISQAQVDDNGNATINVNIGNVPGATTATTTFDDTGLGTPPAGNSSRAAGAREEIEGLSLGRTFSQPGISVAKSVAKDGSGAARAVVRKQISVGERQTGNSGALPAPPDSTVAVKKVTGKFLFNKDTKDQVSFQGTVTLPAGFNPAKPGGNTLVLGMGNIVDTIQIDEKGKPINKSTGANGRITKLSVKFPKLASGAAAGGEKATISATISLANMDTAGFDTEGIAPQLRADEAGKKAVSRFVQLNMVLNGVPYEAYIPVAFKLSSKQDAGQINGRLTR